MSELLNLHAFTVIVSNDVRCKAQCGCGWVGPDRTESDQAQADAREHAIVNGVKLAPPTLDGRLPREAFEG